MGMHKKSYRHVYATAYKGAGPYWSEGGQLFAATVCRKFSHDVCILGRRSLPHIHDGVVSALLTLLKHIDNTYQFMVFQNLIDQNFFF